MCMNKFKFPEQLNYSQRHRPLQGFGARVPPETVREMRGERKKLNFPHGLGCGPKICKIQY